MNYFILIFVGILGAILTYFVSNKMKQGAVRASAILSLLVGGYFYWFPNVLSPYLTQHIPMVFVGTSFIGMLTTNAKGRYLLLALAGIFFTLIYLNKSHFFDGYGGALGSLAFVSVLTVFAFSQAHAKKEHISERISDKRKKRN